MATDAIKNRLIKLDKIGFDFAFCSQGGLIQLGWPNNEAKKELILVLKLDFITYSIDIYLLSLKVLWLIHPKYSILKDQGYKINC